MEQSALKIIKHIQEYNSPFNNDTIRNLINTVRETANAGEDLCIFFEIVHNCASFDTLCEQFREKMFNSNKGQYVFGG